MDDLAKKPGDEDHSGIEEDKKDKSKTTSLPPAQEQEEEEDGDNEDPTQNGILVLLSNMNWFIKNITH